MDIPISDDLIADAVTKAVKELLVRERKQLQSLAEGFLDEAKSAQRLALTEVDLAGENFKTKARTKLAEADAEIAKFAADFAAKKTEVEKALNVKIMAAFSAVVLLLTVVALGYLGDNLLKVSDKSKAVLAAAAQLDQDTQKLQGSIQSANTAYKSAFEANKDPSLATHLTTLEGLTNSMNTTLGTVKSDTESLKVKTAPIIADWAAHHKH